MSLKTISQKPMSLKTISQNERGRQQRRPYFFSWTFLISRWPIQISQNGLAGFFGFGEGFKGRAADLNGASVLIDRTPRRHEASASPKAGTAVALITDHERKAVSIRVPYFHVFDATDDADELHGHSTHERLPFGKAPRPSKRSNLSRGAAVALPQRG